MKTEFQCPNWLKNGVMYQIFPDRFARSSSYISPNQNKEHILREDWGGQPNHLPDSAGIVQNNDFFGGNLRGILEKLPYLSELGVTVLYLNPIFEAYSNHRYDTADYMKIDPLLGTEEDFTTLCREAFSYGIRIILDGVFNHTGSDSLYFNKKGRYPTIGAYQSKESPYYSWFKFSEWPDQYESWWGVDTLPSVDETNPSYLAYILQNEDSVIRHWLRCGASGFRLDVVDELPDLFLDELRQVVKSENQDAAIIGEVWEDASTKISYGQRRRYLDGSQLDSVMNYPLRKSIIRFIKEDQNAHELAATIEGLWRNYPETVFYGLMNFLGTHDTPRILTVFSEDVDQTQARQRLFCALILWALLPGIPSIYYGDELGMTGGKDPFNRRCFIPEDQDPIIFRHYKRLLNFRKKVEQIESMEQLRFEHGLMANHMYSFLRNGSKCRLVVAVNAGQEEELLPLELKEGEQILDYFISGDATFYDTKTFLLKECSGIGVLIGY